ncbi:hypothetical protein V5799_028995 [Amblyomma americanum]|uniref:Secreted protein n=1 Tax=Amblyomma americanum TaxID=6943 RepID=A0AAQ4ESH4_AMBAM
MMMMMMMMMMITTNTIIITASVSGKKKTPPPFTGVVWEPAARAPGPCSCCRRLASSSSTRSLFPEGDGGAAPPQRLASGDQNSHRDSFGPMRQARKTTVQTASLAARLGLWERRGELDTTVRR